MLFSFHMLTTCSDCHMHAHTNAPILHVLLCSYLLGFGCTRCLTCTPWKHVLIISGHADENCLKQKGSLANQWRCAKSYGRGIKSVHVIECVGENVCACETDMNYGGEQSGGRKLSWLSLRWNDSIVKKREEEMRGTSASYKDLYRPTYQKPPIQPGIWCSSLEIWEWKESSRKPFKQQRVAVSLRHESALESYWWCYMCTSVFQSLKYNGNFNLLQ